MLDKPARVEKGEWREKTEEEHLGFLMDKRANGFLVILIGFLFIIVGIAVVLVTFIGFLDQALHLELIPAMEKYIIGVIVAGILFAIGIVIITKG
jgi:ABC-type uncharacterized transport system fused permease/ATPase subunit